MLVQNQPSAAGGKGTVEIPVGQHDAAGGLAVYRHGVNGWAMGMAVHEQGYTVLT